MTKIGWVVFAIECLIITVLIVVLAIYTAHAEPSVIGRIRIPARDIRAEITADDAPTCDCCPALWSGGIVTTTADLSAVRLYDTADIITLDGGYYVLECVEIAPCIRWAKWLIGWRGVIAADGDILIVSASRVYRFVTL